MHRNLGYRRRAEAREPIIIPRWALVAMYVGFVGLGIAASIAGVPQLQIGTWRAYVLFWAAGLTVFAIFGALGAVRAEFEVVEKWSAVGIASILSAYTFLSISTLARDVGEGDMFDASRRIAGVVILLIVNLLPIARAISLLTRTGMHRS